jgi:hypothetical protein
MAEREATPPIYVNVPTSEREEQRIVREEKFWTGTRLSIFCVVFLVACLAVLYVMASTTSETTWGDWLLPWAADGRP